MEQNEYTARQFDDPAGNPVGDMLVKMRAMERASGPGTNIISLPAPLRSAIAAIPIVCRPAPPRNIAANLSGP